MEQTLLARSRGRETEVRCLFKRIRNVHLKVYPDGRVTLSAPLRTEIEWIQNYIDAKAEWIFRARERYERAERPEEGMYCILGRAYRLEIRAGRAGVRPEGEALVVSLPNPETDAVRRRLDQYVREQALAYFVERTEALYPLVRSMGAPPPTVAVRRMKSMWGNCNRNTGAIKYNSVLYCADPGCIDYVVAHELVHLLAAGHQQNFYRILNSILPDWKERKKRLNRLYARYL